MYVLSYAILLKACIKNGRRKNTFCMQRKIVLKDILSASIKSFSQLDISGFPKNILKTGKDLCEFSDKKNKHIFSKASARIWTCLLPKKEELNMLVNNALFIIFLWKECYRIYIGIFYGICKCTFSLFLLTALRKFCTTRCQKLLLFL